MKACVILSGAALIGLVVATIFQEKALFWKGLIITILSQIIFSICIDHWW